MAERSSSPSVPTESAGFDASTVVGREVYTRGVKVSHRLVRLALGTTTEADETAIRQREATVEGLKQALEASKA